MKFLRTALCFFLFILGVSAPVACAQRNTGVAPSNRSLFPVKQDGKWGYIDRIGRLVIEPQFAFAYPYHDGLARVEADGKWGYIDTTGKMVIMLPPQSWYSFFSESLAPLCVSAGTNPNNTIKLSCGYIDKTGKSVIKQQFDEAAEFSEGRAAVKIGDQWGFINRFGRYVINPHFGGVESFRDGVARVWNEKEGNGFIDRFGKYVIPPNLNMSIRSFSEGLAAVTVGGKWGYVNKTGTIAIAPQFQRAFPFSEGLAMVVVDGKWGYINRSGKLVIDAQFKPDEHSGPPFKTEFDLPISFSEGRAAVMVGRKWGYIDKAGKMVIPAQFDEPSPFSDGLAQVKIAERVGYIDKAGAYVWNPTR